MNALFQIMQIARLDDPTPSPVPAYEGDPNLITPGVIGFAITFLIAAATVLLLIDMTRRVRRVRYRDEVREKLAAEAAASASVRAKKNPAKKNPAKPSGSQTSATTATTAPED